MGKLIAAFAAFVGSVLALTSTSLCMWYIFDEVETPKSLIR